MPLLPDSSNALVNSISSNQSNHTVGIKCFFVSSHRARIEAELGREVQRRSRRVRVEVAVLMYAVIEKRSHYSCSCIPRSLWENAY